MFRDEGIDVDQVTDAAARPLGDTGDDQSAIAVADEHDIVEILSVQEIDHIPNVCVERHTLRERAGVGSQAGQRGDEYRTSRQLQPRRHQIPRRAALKCAVYEHDR